MKKNNVLKTLASSREISLLMVMLLIVAIITWRNPIFLTLKNISDMLTNY